MKGELQDFKIGRVVKNRTFIYKGLTINMIFSIGLTTQFLGLVTHAVCKIISNCFYFAFLGNDILISDQKSRRKAIEIVIAFFSFSWKSQGSHVGLFLLCFTYPSLLPLQPDTYIDDW